ncbi:ABC transporter permease [Sulfuricaulis sp.]|jgi:peptide/nickel transport system permease protein|uniref:ABC transporter permease n=1 Tax=Sulfuricaulis sp. TaxID=2003553 RepID=UPI00355A2D8E
MPFQLEFLWTDLLIYLLLVSVIVFAFYTLRHEHLRVPWRQVARRPMAMASLVILSVYVAVGLMDSVHYRPLLETKMQGERVYSNEVLSLLDKMTTRLRTRLEKTYSAPFAVQAYTKETMEYPDGRHAREYPRLLYGGAHLQDPDERAADIARRVGLATLAGLALWILLVAGFLLLWRERMESWIEAVRRLVRGDSQVPWRAVWVTTGILIVLTMNVVSLSQVYHILGTDQVGQDVFYKSLKSIRTGLVIGTLTTLVMLPFAAVFGIMAGYFRGWVDDVIQYTYTTLSSIPGVLLIAAAILSLQVYVGNHPDSFHSATERADIRLLFLCLILGVTSWTSLCRLLRGETLKLREMDYLQAAHALGSSHASVMARHILPNVMHIILITVVLDFSGLVLAEAVLSYVGVGVDPTMDSWGNMINSARLEMAREPVVWWSLASAFVFMFGLVLSANLFSDAVRDAFDPRLRK